MKTICSVNYPAISFHFSLQITCLVKQILYTIVVFLFHRSSFYVDNRSGYVRTIEFTVIISIQYFVHSLRVVQVYHMNTSDNICRISPSKYF